MMNEEPTPRLRIGGAIVNLIVYTDDGDRLTPLSVQPVQMSAAELETFDLDAITAALKAQFAEGTKT